jgi:hypothetical protein
VRNGLNIINKDFGNCSKDLRLSKVQCQSFVESNNTLSKTYFNAISKLKMYQSTAVVFVLLLATVAAFYSPGKFRK